MGNYNCLKACTLGGVDYAAGDIIPADAVLPGRVRALKNQGYIAEVLNTGTLEIEEPDGPTLFAMPIVTEGEPFGVALSQEGVIEIFVLLQSNADEVVTTVAAMESSEVLMLLQAVDSRKTVKTAAAKRITELQAEGSKSGEEDESAGDA